MIRTILFDLDDTLYPHDVGIMDRIRELILLYMRSRLHLAAVEADALRREYLRTYGTTMRGLQRHHQIDPDEYLDFVHDIPLGEHLRPNAALDAALATIRLPKIVFTNASREHAERVLAVLGIRHHFERIVDVRDVGFESKPQPLAYRRICELLDLAPRECLLVEDSVPNLRPAKELGMTTVLISGDGNPAPDVVDHVIPCIEAIGSVIEGIERGKQAAAG